MSDQSREEIIYTGQISYTLFTLCGMWRPLKCNSQWKLKIYQLYYILTVTLFSTFTLFCFVHMFQKHEDTEGLIQSVFYFFSFFAVLFKLMIITKKRKIFIKTDEMLLSKMCQPRDFHEIKILRNYSHTGRMNTICYLIMVHFTALTILLTPLTVKENMTLPLPYWLPFSFESKTIFILSYLHQIIGIIMTAYISAGIDTLALTVMLQMCGQLEIIMHRFSLLSKMTKNHKNTSINYYREAKITKHCIEGHLYVHSIGKNINRQFGLVIFMQFFASMIHFCAIIYNLSNMSLTNRTSWIMISAVSSYTFQIFVYCYYGDKMTEKSSDIGTAIYFINWEELTLNTKKSLIIIMMRTTRPIKLTGSSVIVMSLETFMKIIKSAYSAYNLLKKN